jgi:CubicO group peptidase (beta-lactamase class C family)
MSPDAADAPAYAPALEASIRAIVEKSTVPSAIVIVRSGRYGDVTFTSGATGLGGSVPVSTTDHARFGSITKSMTATIILQLVQEGLLTLDDPVSKFVPGVPDGDNITVAQLLEMRSGLYNFTNDPQLSASMDRDPAKVWTPEEILAMAFAHPPVAEPDQEYEYNNTNYVLLGLIAEKVDGKPLAGREVTVGSSADESEALKFKRRIYHGVTGTTDAEGWCTFPQMVPHSTVYLRPPGAANSVTATAALVMSTSTPVA